MTGVSYTSPTALYVGEQIRRRRVQLGLRQRDLARRMHLDPSILGLWETGRRPVPHSRLEALAAALETTPRALMSDMPLLAQAQVDVLSLPIKPFVEPVPVEPPPPPPLQLDYRKACWTCSTEEHFRLNHKQAQAAILSGRLRCAQCGSAGVELVPMPLTSRSAAA